METLLVTILCWVAVFGVIDNLVSRLKTDAERLAAYGLVGVLAAALAWACRRVTVSAPRPFSRRHDRPLGVVARRPRFRGRAHGRES